MRALLDAQDTRTIGVGLATLAALVWSILGSVFLAGAG